MIKSKASEFSEYLKENYPANNYSVSFRKPLFGIGINDVNYRISPRIEGKQLKCYAYQTWVGMLERVYDEKQRKDYPTYGDVVVCEEWLTFSNFREWFIENHIDNYQIDKDLLVIGNKIYSPDTCIYTPSWLNSFTIDVGSRRGNYKIGVSWDSTKQKFLSRCSHPKTKIQSTLGRFDNEEQAYLAWLNRKLEIALELKYEMDTIDLRIYPNVVEIIKSK